MKNKMEAKQRIKICKIKAVAEDVIVRFEDRYKTITGNTIEKTIWY